MGVVGRGLCGSGGVGALRGRAAAAGSAGAAVLSSGRVVSGMGDAWPGSAGWREPRP
ncbi:hypothetical protein [Sphaerisporangium sp. NPDC051011]|uniref:hypothetical protein n=1 Tax=Sphaerisporangium sp. NPDC051011 TaxID=3155792 RepID=UPI0034018854